MLGPIKKDGKGNASNYSLMTLSYNSQTMAGTQLESETERLNERLGGGSLGESLNEGSLLAKCILMF